MARTNLESARVLHASTSNHRQVYDLAGRAVEEAMIAIRLKANGQMTVPKSDQGAKWHELEFLADRAGLRVALQQDASKRRRLAVHWLTVKDWKSNARFADVAVTAREALDMLNAVGHDDDGILKWLLNRYATI